MVRFVDPDPIEHYVGSTAEAMTPDQLVAYIKAYMGALHQVAMAVDGTKERAIMGALIKVYGTDAGQIVKWVFHKHKGHNEKGDLVRYQDFQRERKWWTDKLHLEMQVARIRELSNAEPIPTLTPATAILPSYPVLHPFSSKLFPGFPLGS